MQITRTWTVQNTAATGSLTLAECREPNEIAISVAGDAGGDAIHLARKEWDALIYAIREFRWTPTPEEEKASKAALAFYLDKVGTEAA
jgi:hypothetical protein